MLISHRRRFVFVHVYKTGGTSVSSALLRYARLREQLAGRFAPTRALVHAVNEVFGLWDEGNAWWNGAHKHATAQELRALLGTERWESYLSFAFVRNPWEWQRSQFRYIRRSANHRDHRRVSGMSFAQFVADQVARDAPAQLDFLCDERGEPIVDRIGRFESLRGDFDAIVREIGLPPTPLPRLNRAGASRDDARYDDATADLVARHFARDVERFSYARPPE